MFPDLFPATGNNLETINIYSCYYCSMRFVIIFIFLSIIVSAQAKPCPEGTYLVQEHPRQSHYRSDGTYVSSTFVSSYCRNYINDGPLKEQYLTKMPSGWPHRKEKFKKCSQQKQKLISNILSTIPKVLTSVGKLQIYCGNQSETPNNPATSSPMARIIVLYNSSFKQNTRRIMIHELAHLLWARLSDKEKNSYQNAGNWSLVQGIYIYNRTAFSEPDGKIGPEEDFANNVEHYFSNTKKFKKNFSKIDT